MKQPKEIRIGNLTLAEILVKHKWWLRAESGGEQANLCRVNLHEVNLRGVDLSKANLREANLQGAYCLGANFADAILIEANLSGANLMCADFRGADLRGANLMESTLSGANLCGADLDYSAWPLSCGSQGVRIDQSIAIQLLFHLMDAVASSNLPDVHEALFTSKVRALVSTFERDEITMPWLDECAE